MVTEEEQISKMEQVSKPQVQSTVIETQQTGEGNEVSHKKVRHRKKALYTSICQLMEFYFSDSNLSKDRFLSELVRKNPDVNIETFLGFNKLRSITTDVSTIAKALKNSTLLQVSEDRTKVRRIIPVVEKTNVDECTVYVQRLPPDADHEYLYNQFSKYGKVTYVSIPKYTNTRKIKGFAFVEFDKPKEAEKCLKDFRARGCELPTQTTPEKVLSITTYQNQENQEENNSNKEPKNVNEEKAEKLTESNNSKKKKKKSKHNNFDNTESNQVESKKQKIENIEECLVVSKKKKVSKEQEINIEEEKKKKKMKRKGHEIFEDDLLECIKPKVKKENNKDSDVHISDSNTGEEKCSKKHKSKHFSEDISVSDSQLQNTIAKSNKKQEKSAVKESEVTTSESDESVEGENEDSEKKKKRKKRNRNKCEIVHTIVEYPLLGMQVMSKNNWKRLRNKYLDLQRAKMKQLKQHLKKVKWNQWGDKSKMEIDVSEIKSNNPASVIEFSPGLIVKVNLNKPCIDLKNFKTEMKNNNNVKYVDIKEGSQVGYIRCDSVEAATTLSEKSSEEKQFSVLTGDEEASYWDQIKKDREEKLHDNRVRQKIRGRKKLLKKAEKELGKHIKFDD